MKFWIQKTSFRKRYIYIYCELMHNYDKKNNLKVFSKFESFFDNPVNPAPFFAI